jgi:phosphoribosylglycinamide formyltransferase 1
MKEARLVVLVSGNGSNLQAILDAIKVGDLPAEVCAVISNKKDAFGLERARQAGIPALVKPKFKEQTREAYDSELAELVEDFQPDWVVLAGWMRILTMPFIGQFPGRIINLHPALPGTFAGVDAINRAYQAYQQGEIIHTGVMVHYVLDESVDMGPVINQRIVVIEPGDTLADLESRIHACEHTLLVESLQQLVNQREDENA